MELAEALGRIWDEWFADGGHTVSSEMTVRDWTGLSLQVVATVAAALAAIAAWRSVVGVSREREADKRWRADEHLKTIHTR